MASLDLVKKQKPIPGFGSEGGLYGHPHPDVHIVHLRQAVAAEPNAFNPKITIQASQAELIS